MARGKGRGITRERIAAVAEYARQKRIEAGLPADDPEDVEAEARRARELPLVQAAKVRARAKSAKLKPWETLRDPEAEAFNDAFDREHGLGKYARGEGSEDK
jgi:hypothetical protein